MTEEKTEEREEEQQEEEGGEEGQSQEQVKAKEVAEEREKAENEMEKLEKQDEVPVDLDEWPSGKGKYVTFGGQEGEHSYNEGPESKLGPSELRRFEDGSVSIAGKKVDNPDEHKAGPIPGGPTDPDAPGGGPEKSKEDEDDDE